MSRAFHNDLDGGSGIHYSFVFISLKNWVIHKVKTKYSLKSDYSLFIIFFFYSLKNRIIHYF